MDFIEYRFYLPSAALAVSLAASALCIWSSASSKYQAVTKKVAPKKAKHAEVTAVLKEAQAELQIKLDEERAKNAAAQDALNWYQEELLQRNGEQIVE